MLLNRHIIAKKESWEIPKLTLKLHISELRYPDLQLLPYKNILKCTVCSCRTPQVLFSPPAQILMLDEFYEWLCFQFNLHTSQTEVAQLLSGLGTWDTARTPVDLERSSRLGMRFGLDSSKWINKILFKSLLLVSGANMRRPSSALGYRHWWLLSCTDIHVWWTRE